MSTAQPSCPICMEAYGQTHIPLIFPQCGHSICKICVIQLINNNNFDSLHCPIDRQEVLFQGENETVSNFPKNYALMEVINSKKHLFFKSRKLRCQTHNMPLKFICQTDFQTLCLKCLTKHTGNEHQLTDLKDTFTQNFKEVQNLVEEMNKTNSQWNQKQFNFKANFRKSEATLRLNLEKDVDNFFTKILEQIKEELEKRRVLAKNKIIAFAIDKFEANCFDKSLENRIEKYIINLQNETNRLLEQFSINDFENGRFFEDLPKLIAQTRFQIDNLNLQIQNLGKKQLEIPNVLNEGFIYEFNIRNLYDCFDRIIQVFTTEEDENHNEMRLRCGIRPNSQSLKSLHRIEESQIGGLKTITRKYSQMGIKINKPFKKIRICESNLNDFGRNFSFVSIPESITSIRN